MSSIFVALVCGALELLLNIPSIAFAEESKPTNLPAPRAQEIVSVTRVVGEAGDRIVTSRETIMNRAIEQVIAPVEATKTSSGAPAVVPLRILTGFDKDFANEVTLVLDEWVVYLEAKTLSASPADRGEVSRLQKQVHDKWAGDERWKALEPSNDEIREMIERKLIVREFIRLKTDPSLAPISDEEAMAYFKKNRLRFGSLPFASFKDNIKTFLTKQQTERRMLEWQEVLRRKYKTRNFISG